MVTSKYSILQNTLKKFKLTEKFVFCGDKNNLSLAYPNALVSPEVDYDKFKAI